jgi:low molecular weight phosphotyrosine protein phosphatase
MDRDNLRDLQRLHQRAGLGKASVKLFGEYSGKKRAEEVDDPYYGGRDGFEEAYQQLTRFTRNFLKEKFPEIEA